MLKFVRLILFMVFFTAGVAALGLSILTDDIRLYYHDKQILADANDELNRLEAMIADYNILIDNLRSDPNMYKRIAPVTLGIDNNEPNTAYPQVSHQTREAAELALRLQSENFDSATLPPWLERISQPRKRLLLFGSGSALVLIAFIFFGEPKKKPTTKEV